MNEIAEYKNNDDYILQRQVCSNAVSAPLEAIKIEVGTIRYFINKGMVTLPAIKLLKQRLTYQCNLLRMEKESLIIKEKVFLVNKLINDITL